MGDTENGLTRTGSIVGSPQYMAPEQAQGLRTIDARADIWALGVVLYQLVTGTLPFTATNATSLAALIASEPPTPLASVRPDIPSAFAEAVERCLRKNAAERFASVVELARALADLAPGANGSADRVSRVARVAAARKLSLAATQPEEDEELPSSSTGSSGAYQPARVTAELTDAPPVGQRTDYGSEVVRKPSSPPPRESRRGRMIAVSGLAAAVALGLAVRGRLHAPPSSPATLPSSPSRLDALAPPAAAGSSIGPDVVRDASVSTHVAEASSAPPLAPATVLPATQRPARRPTPVGMPSAGAVPSPASASPLDIDLK